MATELTLDEFLGHNPSSGGRTNRLKKWKDNKFIDTVMHTKSAITAVWQMGWPRVVSFKDKDGVESVEVWGGDFNTWEKEAITKEQYKRDPNTNERLYPPELCPYQMFLERIHALIHSGEMDWLTPLFEFHGDDPDKSRTLRAGGMTGMFGAKELSATQKKQMKKAGISPKHAWKEKATAKCNYVFRMVDIANPDKGVQIATETTLLGDKVRGKIQDEMISLGKEKAHLGNPMKNPYVIRWVYDEKATNFSDKYKALIMRNEEISPEVMRLITETDAPSISHITDVSNPVQLRADMETFYVGPDDAFDWDEIFGPSTAIWEEDHGTEDADEDDDESTGTDTPAADGDDDDDDDDAEEKAALAALAAAKEKKKARKAKAAAEAKAAEEAKGKSKAKPKTKTKAKPAKEDPADRVIPEDKQCLCQECQKVIHDDDMVCPFCGFDYTPDEEGEAADPDEDGEAAPESEGTPTDGGDDLGF